MTQFYVDLDIQSSFCHCQKSDFVISSKKHVLLGKKVFLLSTAVLQFCNKSRLVKIICQFTCIMLIMIFFRLTV